MDAVNHRGVPMDHGGRSLAMPFGHRIVRNACVSEIAVALSGKLMQRFGVCRKRMDLECQDTVYVACAVCCNALVHLAVVFPLCCDLC